MTSSSRKPASLSVIWQAMKIWYDDWFNLFVMNFLTTLSWVTIILGPPMLFGLYEVGHDLAHGRSSGVTDLFQAAKRHFLVSWLWALVNIVVGVIVAVNVIFYWRLAKSWSIFLVSVFLFLGIFWVMAQMYVIPYYMEQKTISLKLAHKNAALTFLAAPGYTLALFLFSLLLLGVSFGFILPLILAGPALVIITGSYAVSERLRAYGVSDAEQTP